MTASGGYLLGIDFDGDVSMPLDPEIAQLLNYLILMPPESIDFIHGKRDIRHMGDIISIAAVRFCYGDNMYTEIVFSEETTWMPKVQHDYEQFLRDFSDVSYLQGTKGFEILYNCTTNNEIAEV